MDMENYLGIKLEIDFRRKESEREAWEVAQT